MAEPIITKRCYVCKQVKTTFEFNKNCRTKDGYQIECKACHSDYQRQYRHTAQGKAAHKRHRQTKKYKNAQKRYDQSRKGKKTHKKAKQSYYIRRPECIKAKDAIQRAIKSGKLPRANALQCSCGERAKQYHHHKGYDKKFWLDVVPVCISCHNNLYTFLNISNEGG